MLNAWSAGMPGKRTVEGVVVQDRQVMDGVLPMGAKELVVDVYTTANRAVSFTRPLTKQAKSRASRAKRPPPESVGTDDSGNPLELVKKNVDEHYVVEIQHRPEPLFPHRALLYSSAAMVKQHKDRPDTDTSDALCPVHTLAFCDYSFNSGDFGSGIGAEMTTWRTRPVHEPDLARVVNVYALQPVKSAMAQLKQGGNEHLDQELFARMSFTFALLPFAPPLSQLSSATPPLLRWASLVAHVNPHNIDEVPKDVRTKGVSRLLDVLHDTKDQTELERLRALEDQRAWERTATCAYDDGLAQGVAQGELKMLRRLGIASPSEYRAKMGHEPPEDVARMLDEAQQRTPPSEPLQ